METRTQVNIKSERLRSLLDQESEKLGISIKDCAEQLVKKGLDYDLEIAKAKKEVAETKQVLEMLRTKSKLFGIDLDKPITESIESQKSQELGIVDLRRKAEELEQVKSERDGLLSKISKLTKKVDKHKKRAKRLEEPDFLDRIFAKVEENPNTMGMIIEKFGTAKNQQLAGAVSETDQQAKQLYEFFVKNFNQETEQGMMVSIMQTLATNKDKLTEIFNQLTGNNGTATN